MLFERVSVDFHAQARRMVRASGSKASHPVGSLRGWDVWCMDGKAWLFKPRFALRCDWFAFCKFVRGCREVMLGPGVYVSWRTLLGHKRYGCIVEVETHRQGWFIVQASNGRFPHPWYALEHEPNCTDAIALDQRVIYGHPLQSHPVPA